MTVADDVAAAARTTTAALDGPGAAAALRALGAAVLEHGAQLGRDGAATLVAALARVVRGAPGTERARLAANALGNACVRARDVVAQPCLRPILGALCDGLAAVLDSRALAKPTPVLTSALIEAARFCSSALRAVHLLLSEPVTGLTAADAARVVALLAAALEQGVAFLRAHTELSMSDSDLSDAETAGGRMARSSDLPTKLLLNALVCGETFVRRAGKLVHAHWLALVPATVGGGPLLGATLATDDARVHAQAARCLAALIEVSTPLLVLAEQRRRAGTTSFVSLSEQLALSLAGLHVILARQLQYADGALVEEALCRTTTALARASPYAKLHPGTVDALASAASDLLRRQRAHYAAELLRRDDAQRDRAIAAGLEAVAACAMRRPTDVVRADGTPGLLVDWLHAPRGPGEASSLVVVAAWAALRALVDAAPGALDAAQLRDLVDLAVARATFMRLVEHEQTGALQFVAATLQHAADCDDIVSAAAPLLDRLATRTAVAADAVPAEVVAAAIDVFALLGEDEGERVVRVLLDTLEQRHLPGSPKVAAWTAFGGPCSRLALRNLACGVLDALRFSLTDRGELLAVKTRAAWALVGLCDALARWPDDAAATAQVTRGRLSALVVHVCEDSDKVRCLGLRAAGALVASCLVLEPVLAVRLLALMTACLTDESAAAKTRWNAGAAAVRVFSAAALVDVWPACCDLARAAHRVMEQPLRPRSNFKVRINATAALSAAAARDARLVPDGLLASACRCLRELAAPAGEGVPFSEQAYRGELAAQLHKLIGHLLLAGAQPLGDATGDDSNLATAVDALEALARSPGRGAAAASVTDPEDDGDVGPRDAAPVAPADVVRAAQALREVAVARAADVLARRLAALIVHADEAR